MPPDPAATADLSPADREELARARSLLENPGLAPRIAAAVGRPVEWVLARLPARAEAAVAKATRTALSGALEAALRTLDPAGRGAPANRLHRALVVATGAVGGAFGWVSLPLELPVSTALMLRSIADHARAQGEDLSATDARLECLAVFALGGRTPDDDPSEAGYFAVRTALARALADAARFVTERGVAAALADETAPAIARFVAKVAARFAPAVAEKLGAQAVPLLGAAGGAAVNTLFMAHYQEMAWGHFTVRRLERAYGAEVVRRAYAALDGR